MEEKEQTIDEYFFECMKTRNGMFDSLIKKFMEETGLKASEIILVEQLGEDGFKYFYAKKNTNYKMSLLLGKE